MPSRTARREPERPAHVVRWSSDKLPLFPHDHSPMPVTEVCDLFNRLTFAAKTGGDVANGLTVVEDAGQRLAYIHARESEFGFHEVHRTYNPAKIEFVCDAAAVVGH